MVSLKIVWCKTMEVLWNFIANITMKIAILFKPNKELLLKYKKLEVDFMDLVIESKNICLYCKNNIECKGKDCEKYIEGEGCYDENKRYFRDWKWTCQDFNFGTCPLLENTPCNGCFENDFKGFEWRA